MRSTSIRWSSISGWSDAAVAGVAVDYTTQLLLAFGPVDAPPPAWFDDVRERWPLAQLIYTTAGGQIDTGSVLEQDVVLTAVSFDNVQVHTVTKTGAGVVPCEELGAALAIELAQIDALKHVMVFVDGLQVNGTAFTRGLNRVLPRSVTLSGGLASDGTDFVRTGVGCNGAPVEGQAVAVALVGESLVVGTGSAGGWIPFGPERRVTRAEGPVVFELDGEPALATYKRYLGDLAAELPGSALLFPLSMDSNTQDGSVVRTILGIDEAAGSLRFAGEVLAGSRVRLMRSTNDQLLDGAAAAANDAVDAMEGVTPSLLVCVSCIGRRAVLKSRVEEEIDEVLAVVPGAVVTGYYSNGEIAPVSARGGALLHNQTMTITAFGER